MEKQEGQHLAPKSQASVSLFLFHTLSVAPVSQLSETLAQ